MSDRAPARTAALPVPAIVAIAGGFGLFYAYAAWSAVTLLIAQATGPLGLNGLGWFVLLAAVLFPLALFAGAFALGWRRGAGWFALIMLVGLALTAVFWLNVLGYAYAYGAALLGG